MKTTQPNLLKACSNQPLFLLPASIDPSFVLEKHHVPGGDQDQSSLAGVPGGRSLTTLTSQGRCTGIVNIMQIFPYYLL